MTDTVLVVEDDDANAVLIQAILSNVGGFGAVWSQDGDEVLGIVSSGTVVAVVMDVSLRNTLVAGEKVDGVELTRRLRLLPEGRHLPVVLLTAHAMRGDRETLLFSSGANDYVAKPIEDQQAFVELLRNHIKASKPQRSNG
jgi:CheY-like chemotaxis protein